MAFSQSRRSALCYIIPGRLLELVEQGLMDVNDPTPKSGCMVPSCRARAPSSGCVSRMQPTQRAGRLSRMRGNRSRRRSPPGAAERRSILPKGLSAPVRRPGHRRSCGNPHERTDRGAGEGNHERNATGRRWSGAQFCSRVASPAGFEPTAPGLGILCSILLSYGDSRASYNPPARPRQPRFLIALPTGRA